MSHRVYSGAQGSLYAVRVDNAIKLGRSLNPRGRIRAIQTGTASPAQLLSAIPQALISERSAHEQWGHLRLRGEWFTATPDLLAWIAGWEDVMRRFVVYGQRWAAAIENRQFHAWPRRRPLHHLVYVEQRVLEIQTALAKLDRRIAWSRKR